MVRATLAVALLSSLLSFATAQTKSDQKPVGIDWKAGPTTADLGGIGEIELPSGYKFAGREGAQRVLELTHNPSSGKEVGVLIPVLSRSDSDRKLWIMYFEFDEIGYVKDDEKDKLDNDALLKSLTDATEQENKVRQERGWPAFHVVGWYKPPFYDPQTHNLTWAILGRDEKGEESVNYSTRVLGRRGTMNVDLVLDPDSVTKAVPQFNSLLGAFHYRAGNTYADFTKGDKIAEYGLAALVAGGTGAALIKSGILLKLWKVIVAGFVAFIAFLKRILAKLKSVFSNEEKPATLPPTST